MVEPVILSEIAVITNHRRSFQFSKTILMLILFVLTLTPSTNFISGFPSVRGEDIILLSWLFFVFPFIKHKLTTAHKIRLGFLGAFFILLPLSIFNGIINGYEGSFSDFNQFIRLLKYISIYLLAVYVFSNASRTEILKLVDYILWLGVFVFLLSLSQYFNVLGLNEIYVSYIAPTQYMTLVNNYPFPRPVAMIGNPNELGFLFVIFSMLSLVMLMEKSRDVSKFKYSFFFTIYLLGVLVTLSRGSLVALVAGVLVFFSWIFLSSKFRVKIKILVVLFCIIMIGLLILNNPLVYESFTWRFMTLLNVLEDASFSTRIDNWQENIGIIKQHPFLGVGPLRRTIFEYSADNEWILLWRSYGVVGVSLFMGLMMGHLFSKCTNEVKAFSMAIIISIFVYMIPAAAFHSLVLFPFLLVILAIVDTKRNGITS